jgi:hypothetical protein
MFSNVFHTMTSFLRPNGIYPATIYAIYIYIYKSACVYVCMYVRLYVYIYTYTLVYVSTYVPAYSCVFPCWALSHMLQGNIHGNF